MHVNIQHRFNPVLGKEGLYYRLKESYRDVRGNVHSLIVLNVGFVPELDANQMRRIAYALTDRFKNRNSQRLFGDDLSILTEQERGYAEHFWQRMIDEHMIDRFNSREAVARKESERYIDIDTTEHTDAREVGAEWLCKQTIDRLGLEYFLRTNVQTLDERTTWDYYNLIREIETTNRQLKTDLSLRAIYHQKDNRSDAHLFFGLLAYWVVNTIRYELKQNGINCYWTEIVRRMSTQKLVTTEGINPLGDKVELRQCSRPKKSAVEIYRALNYKEAPFKKIKICRTQPPPD